MMEEHNLPTSRSFLTSLIKNLSTGQRPEEDRPNQFHDQSRTSLSNPLKNAPQNIRSTLLTLHVLFPNELLPALDVLDRGLVTRLILVQSQHQSANDEDEGSQFREQQSSNSIYLVRSAQQPSSHAHYHRGSGSRGESQSRYHDALASTSTHYEVRLSSWNCSCPAFTFSAFPLSASDEDGPSINFNAEVSSDGTGNGWASEDEWTFGGLILQNSPAGMAVCKHVLACVLVEKCAGYFGEGVEVREVGREEYAGWCAGWGG